MHSLIICFFNRVSMMSWMDSYAANGILYCRTKVGSAFGSVGMRTVSRLVTPQSVASLENMGWKSRNSFRSVALCASDVRASACSSCCLISASKPGYSSSGCASPGVSVLVELPEHQNQNSFICQVCLHIQEIALVSLVHKKTTI